jgi:hypothetical protein
VRGGDTGTPYVYPDDCTGTSARMRAPPAPTPALAAAASRGDCGGGDVAPRRRPAADADCTLRPEA